MPSSWLPLKTQLSKSTDGQLSGSEEKPDCPLLLKRKLLQSHAFCFPPIFAPEPPLELKLPPSNWTSMSASGELEEQRRPSAELPSLKVAVARSCVVLAACRSNSMPSPPLLLERKDLRMTLGRTAAELTVT